MMLKNYFQQGRLSYAVAAAVAIGVIGCASGPKPDQTIEDARHSIQQVESQPLAGEVAAKEIDDAHVALRDAESLAAKHRPEREIANAAYVAKRHAQIAQEQIMAAAAKKQTERAEADKQAVILQAREREAALKGQQADQAKLQADQAKQEANSAKDEATLAKQDADIAKAQAEQERMRAERLDRELQELNAKKTERGYVLTMGDVLFDTAQATLKPGAIQNMDRLAAFLKDAKDRSVVIEGHTDSVGTESYNQDLSQRRADTVQQALISRGIPSDRIVAIGKGKSFPIASNDSAGGRQQNRRVEIVIDNPQRTSANTAADIVR